MPAFDQVLANIIDRATAEVADAVRANVIDEIARARKGSPAAPRTTRRGPTRAARKPAPKPSRPAARKPQKARRGVVIDAGHAAQVLALLEKSPGLRAEEITKRLGGQAEAIKAVLAALRAAGRVKATGKARGTRYSAG